MLRNNSDNSRFCYSLNQAACCWGTTLATVLTKGGFQASRADPALYLNHEPSEFLAVHVDYSLFVAKEDDGFTSWLRTHFRVHNFGKPRHLLSIELTWTNTSVSLAQITYLPRIIKKYCHSEAKPLVTPPSPSECPQQREQPEPPTDLKEYPSVIGCIL